MPKYEDIDTTKSFANLNNPCVVSIYQQIKELYLETGVPVNFEIVKNSSKLQITAVIAALSTLLSHDVVRKVDNMSQYIPNPNLTLEQAQQKQEEEYNRETIDFESRFEA